MINYTIKEILNLEPQTANEKKMIEFICELQDNILNLEKKIGSITTEAQRDSNRPPSIDKTIKELRYMQDKIDCMSDEYQTLDNVHDDLVWLETRTVEFTEQCTGTFDSIRDEISKLKLEAEL